MPLINHKSAQIHCTFDEIDLKNAKIEHDEQIRCGMSLDQVVIRLFRRIDRLTDKVTELENTVADMILTGAHEKELNVKH